MIAASLPQPAALHVVCAWCKDVIREGDRTQPASHGICEPCAEKFRKGGRA